MTEYKIMGQLSPTLSVCMIVKNESHQLAGTLQSISSFADEMVVVDTGSTDDTRKIAATYTEHVYDFPWSGDFAAARNCSLDHATGDYVLWMDADDRIEKGCIDRLRTLKRRFDGKTAFYFVLHEMRQNGVLCALYQMRCVPNRADVRFKGKIHEQLMLGCLDPQPTDIIVEHHGNVFPEIQDRKLRRNLSILEGELAEGREDALIHYYISLTHEGLRQYPQALQHMQRAAEHLERQIRFQSSHSNEMSAQLLPFPQTALREANYYLAKFSMEMGDHTQTQRFLLKSDALTEDDMDMHLRLAKLFQRSGDHRRAIESYRKALKGNHTVGLYPTSNPPSPQETYVDIAYNLLCLEQYERGMDILQQLWSAGATVSSVWERIGTTAVRDGKIDLAHLALEYSWNGGEMTVDGLFILARIFKAKGLKSKAIACCEEGLARDPGCARLRDLRGTLT